MTLDERAEAVAMADPEVRRMYRQAVWAWFVFGMALFFAPWHMSRAKRFAETTNKVFVRRADRVRRAYLRAQGWIA